jgi:DNA-binding transcriptional LysR family regulator
MRGVRFRTLAGMTRSIGIIYRKARPLSHASRALVDLLRDAAEGEPLKPARP